MITAVIIEDERHSRESLRSDLEKKCPQVKVVGEADGIVEGERLIRTLRPELLFLDIELSDGSGFELLEKLAVPGMPFLLRVIFTTSHNQFAIKAFRFSAVDYLLKPVDPDELVSAVNKALAMQAGNLQVLLNNLNRAQPAKIALSVSDSILVYRVDEIVRLESQRNYTQFFFTRDKPLLVSKTLKEYEELLTAYGFERIHNSHLVNLGFVKKYVKSDGGYLIMEDGSNVPVAQSRKENLVKLLSNL